MANNAVTSSAALDGLKNKLTQLSETLHDIYNMMSEDVTRLGETWQDSKYQEFLQGFKPRIDKCEEISVRYRDWCNKVLSPTIERIIAVEETDVSGSGL